MSETYSDDFGNGSGYDLCGPQSYQVFERIGNANFVVNYISLSMNSEVPPRGVLSLETSNINDKGRHDMILEVILDDFGKKLE